MVIALPVLEWKKKKSIVFAVRVRLTETPFIVIEGIYQMADGERRVMVLIEILSKPVAVRVAPASLRKAS